MLEITHPLRPSRPLTKLTVFLLSNPKFYSGYGPLDVSYEMMWNARKYAALLRTDWRNLLLSFWGTGQVHFLCACFRLLLLTWRSLQY